MVKVFGEPIFGEPVLGEPVFGEAIKPLGEPNIQKKAPGFFGTLRNPWDLWTWESLPVAAYQWLSGNTKQKQAAESAKWLKDNQYYDNIKDTEEYKYHEKVMRLYGHTLDETPFSMSAVKEALKSNPGMFTGELVNALVADPYLILPIFWEGWIAKGLQTTSAIKKATAIAPKITTGTTRAIGVTPTMAGYSAVHQLSERGDINPNRLAAETAFGGAAAFAMGTLFSGAGGKLNTVAGIKPENLTAELKPYMVARADWDPTAKAWLDDLKTIENIRNKTKLEDGDTEALGRAVTNLLENQSDNLKLGLEPQDFFDLPSFKGNYVEATSNGLDTVKVIGKPEKFWDAKKYNYISRMELPGRVEYPPGSGNWIRNRIDLTKPEHPVTNPPQGGAVRLNQYFWYNDFAPKHKLELDTDQLYSGYLNFLKNKNNKHYDYLSKFSNFKKFQLEKARIQYSILKGRTHKLTDTELNHKALDQLVARTKLYNYNIARPYEDVMTQVHKYKSNIVKNLNERSFHIRNLKKVETPLVLGAAFGAGGYIANEEKGIIPGMLLGMAPWTVVKTAGAIMTRYKNLAQGLKVSNYDEAALRQRFAEYNKDMPDKISFDDFKVKNDPMFYHSVDAQKKDLIALGRLEESQLLKERTMSSSLLNDYKMYTEAGALLSDRLVHQINKRVPNPKSREMITHYIQAKDAAKSKYAEQLTPDELKMAKEIEDIFDKFWKLHEFDADLRLALRDHYLPGFWRRNEWKTVEDMMTQFRQFWSKTEKGRQLTGRLAAEEKKKIPTYQEGIALGYKPRTLDISEIVRIYSNSMSHALAERKIQHLLFHSPIKGLDDGVGGFAKLMYKSLPKDAKGNLTAIADDYVKFYHPSFLKKKDVEKFSKKQLNKMAPFVHKEAEPIMRMLFDAREEGAILKAINNVNFLMKRFAVGYSFFHAETLLNNMMFTGVRLTEVIKTPFRIAGALIPGVKKHPFTDWSRTTAERMIKEGGNGDDMMAATRAGVVFSHPGDIGYNRFWNMINNAQDLLDRHPNWATYLTKNGIKYAVEYPYKFIDRITWDQIYNSGKLYAFQTARIKQLSNPANKDVPLKDLDIKAAEFVNDAYGGLDWSKLYMNITDPVMKKIAAEAYRPSGLRLQQILLFAPDWTTANIRIIAKSFPGINKDATSRALYQSYLIRAGLILGTGGAALQMAFTGTNILDNKDPTKVDLGNGYSLTLSKQFFEPFHWAVHPYKTLVSKQGSTLKLTEQLLFNKRYLSSPWDSPISKDDVISLNRALAYGEEIGMSFLPFGIRQLIQEQKKNGLGFDDAIRFLLATFGHPAYKKPRNNPYPGLENILDNIN